MKINMKSAGIKAVLITTLFCLSSAPLMASEEAVPDVRILIDISGSMKDSDPNNLRGPALELLVQQLPDGAKAGVWTFGQWVNMLVKHREIDSQWREQAIAAIDQITTHGLYTNIPQALETATYDIDRLKPQYQTSLIVLTDGRVELSDISEENAAARARVLNELLPKIADAGVAVHTVALSTDADNTLLQTLARESNGLSARAESADQLNSVFLQALDAAAPKGQVPLSGNLFLIDGSVDEFTLLVFKAEVAPQTSLVSPSGESYDVSTDSDRVRWYSSDSYDLITVLSPLAGEWSLFAEEHADNRVSIVSNLELQVDRIAKNPELGKAAQLKLRFLDDGATINDRAFLGLIELSATLFSADDKQWDIVSEPVDINGEYRLSLPELNSTGDYELVVSVDGKTFKRVDTQMFTAVEPVPVGVSQVDPAKTANESLPIWLWVAAAVILLLLGGGLFYYFGYFSRGEDYDDEGYDGEYDDEFIDESDGFNVEDEQDEDWDDIPILTEPADEFELIADDAEDPVEAELDEFLDNADFENEDVVDDGGDSLEFEDVSDGELETADLAAETADEEEDWRDLDVAFDENEGVTASFSGEEPDWDESVKDRESEDSEGNDRRE